MKLLSTVLLVCALQGARATELTELRSRAAAIIEQEDAREITTEQARRKVQLLLKDFEAWADAHAVELELKSRGYTSPPDNPDDVDDGDDAMAVNLCPLFYYDDSEELCLIDLKRSEVWSASMLLCRYVCE
ncbi:MAG: hypothetical protein BMS9Abin37_1345 [Acidobacteriota bacterium]|nr:MAG: hypothetical protein BMS9Abin37_1345 [Acidobacteriota bacterium]